MATGRSFSSMSQAQINQHCTQRALRKQQQKREKEEQLYTQLDNICQRQLDAHKRNRELLRDFRRIEQELALLTARTDTYRKIQENCKNQLQTLLTRHYKCLGSSSDATSHTDHSCNSLINKPEGTNNYFCKHCHLTTSLVPVLQAPVISSLCPNQHIESRSFCTNSTCYCIMCPQCNGHFGNVTPDEFKIPDTTLESQSQKKEYPTKDSFYHRDCILTCNTKGARIRHYPEVINNNDGPIKCRTIHTHVDGESHQCVWNTDNNGIYTENLLMRPPLRIKGDEVDQAIVETSAEDNSRKIPVLHQAVPSISKSHQTSSVSSSKSQYLPLSPSATHDYNRNDLKTTSNSSQRILSGQLYDRSPEDETPEQTMIPHPFIKGQSYNSENSTDRLGLSFSLKAKSVHDGFEGGEVINDGNQINKENKSSRTNDNGDISEVQCRQELKMSNFLVERSISEDRMTTESNSGCSISSKGQEKKEKSIVNGDTRSEMGSLLVDYFFIKRDRKEGMMGLDIMEQEIEPSEDSESQNEELEDDDNNKDDHNADGEDGEDDDDDNDEADDYNDHDDDHENVDNDENIEIINGNFGFTERKTSKNKMTKNTGKVVMGDTGISGMYGVDRETKSNKKDEENKEKTESESSGHKIRSIVIVGEGGHKIGKDKSNEIISEKEENGSQMVMVEEGAQQDIFEEYCNTEENETIITHERRNKEESNTEEEQDISSEGETDEKADISEEEESLCDYQDERDSLDGSEEEENTDFWGSKDEGTESEIEEKQAHVSLGRSQQEDASEHIDVDNSTRESQILRKRCSKDGVMNLPQMNPVESRSLLPAQEAPTSTTFSRNTEADFIPETEAEDIKEELLHSENESERPNQAWSDSEDNVHSFYD